MFYEKLQLLCQERGITPSALAKELGLSTGNLSKWKNGGRPRADTVQKIASYLNVSMDALLQDEAPQTLSDIQYALYHETAGVSAETLNRILEFARFAKAEEIKRSQTAGSSAASNKGTDE